MATRTTISALTIPELAGVILISCNGLVPVDLLWDRIASRLDNEDISASMAEAIEALRGLIKGGQLRLKDIILEDEKVSVRLEFSET